MAKREVESKKPDGLIAEAIERFRIAREASETNRERAKAAIRFRDLDQWPEDIKTARENDPDGPRPCLTLDKINQYVNQVKNDERQNRPAIKVRPVDDAGDIKVAEIYQGIIRDIEDCSSADSVYDGAFEQAADGGFGYWRVVPEFADEMSFDQVPRLKRIPNRFSVALSPYFQEADGSDRKWGFVFERLPPDEFERTYPGKKKISFEEYGEHAAEWCEEMITVAEYFRLEETDVEIAQLEDGSVMYLDEVPEGAAPIATRKTTRTVCKWSKLTCAEELDTREFPCKYIPIVEVVGNEINMDGKRMLSGLVRGAMDAMRMYNYGASAFVENVSLAPKVPYVGAEAQFEGREIEWAQANRRNFSALTYKPVLEGGVLVPPPQRQSMVGIPAGWQQVMQNHEHDVQTAMGMYASNLGEQTQATSGRQEIALQKRGDTATFHYVDNLSRAIRFTGRILIDIIQRTHDAPRLARILREDGTTDQARLDPEQVEAIRTITGEDGKPHDSYNLQRGKYDVTVSAGPSYATKRLEAAEFLLNSMQAAKDPVTGQVLTYLAFKASDWAGADDATKMLKKLLPPPLLEEEGRDQEPGQVIQTTRGPLPVAQVPQALAAMEQQLMQAQEVIQKAQADKQASEVMKQQNEQSKLAIENDRVQIERDQMVRETENDRLKAIADAEKARAEAEKYQLEQIQASAELIRAAAENIHAQMEADAPKGANGEQKPQVPSIEDIARLIVESRQPIQGLTITAPSGATYGVKVLQ